MSRFRQALREALLEGGGEAGSDSDRRWLYVPYDQLNEGFGPLATEPPGELGLVFVESLAKRRG